MIKAAFFDIDGTLLTSQGNISKSTFQAVAKLREQGIKCFIASGRGPFSAEELIGQIPMDGYVLYNGQIVFTQTEGVYQHPFTKETLTKLAQFGDRGERQMIFGSRKNFYGSQSMKMGQTKWLKKVYQALPKGLSPRKINEILKKNPLYRKQETPFSELPLFNTPIYQCILMSPLEEHEKLVETFPDCTITRSNPFSVDIIPAGGSKLVGIKQLVAHYGITLEETIAFGDSWNDVEMLAGVGMGVAMGNGMPDVQEIADYVTSSNDDNGIYQALISLNVIK